MCKIHHSTFCEGGGGGGGNISLVFLTQINACRPYTMCRPWDGLSGHMYDIAVMHVTRLVHSAQTMNITTSNLKKF